MLCLHSNEIRVLRTELGNIRKQIQGLKFEHKKDIEAIIKNLSHDPFQTSSKKLNQKPKKSELEDFSDQFKFRPIGFVRSCHETKNGSPRQPTVSPDSRGVIDVSSLALNNPEFSLDSLEEFSHIWIIFVFHQNPENFAKTKVAPPRLGGKRVGIFSTRSPHRPNPIGLTLAKIDAIQGTEVSVSGLDLITGTPILDIKPYIPQYDMPLMRQEESKVLSDVSLDEAGTSVRVPSWISDKSDLKVIFTPRALDDLNQLKQDQVLNHLEDVSALQRAIVNILRADPRSNYRREKCQDRLYFFQVDAVHVTCWFDEDVAEVLKLSKRE